MGGRDRFLNRKRSPGEARGERRRRVVEAKLCRNLDRLVFPINKRPVSSRGPGGVLTWNLPVEGQDHFVYEYREETRSIPLVSCGSFGNSRQGSAY